MTAPYYQDDLVTLYHGDWRDHTDIHGDVIVTDPPYGETPLPWDRWPAHWPEVAHDIAPAMWCFGSFRMFMDNRADFNTWKFSHEIVWQKHAATGLAVDKFRRIHELAAFWYHGDWRNIYHRVPRVESNWSWKKPVMKRSGTKSQTQGSLKPGEWADDGMRYQTTIIEARNGHRRSIHPTQKPLAVLTPLIQYSCPPGGTVVDLFSGSGSVALAARNTGRKCVAFEIDEAYCEASANRLAQQGFVFDDEGESA
jgi:site-specific DNA-methyltransferase (adenine-specific)